MVNQILAYSIYFVKTIVYSITRNVMLSYEYENDFRELIKMTKGNDTT